MSRPAKKSKFSVTPFSPDSTSSLSSSSRISQRNESISKKTSAASAISEIRGDSFISGLEEIKEDCVQSKSDVNFDAPKQEVLVAVPDNVLENEQLHSKSRCWKSSFKESRINASTYRPSAFETCEDYYNTNKENFRRTEPRKEYKRQSNWATTSISSRISSARTPLVNTSNFVYGQDVYQLLGSMENKLENLKVVIEKQKTRLHSPSPVNTREGLTSSLYKRNENKSFRSSRSDYLKR